MCLRQVSGYFSPSLMLAIDPRVKDMRLVLVGSIEPDRFRYKDVGAMRHRS